MNNWKKDLLKKYKELKKGGENKLMITKEHAMGDLSKLEKYAKTDVAKLLLGIAKVVVKVVVSIRSNQLLTEEDKQRIKEEKKQKQEQKQQEEKNTASASEGGTSVVEGDAVV